MFKSIFSHIPNRHLLKKRMMIFKVHQICEIIVTYRLGIVIGVRSRQPIPNEPITT